MNTLSSSSSIFHKQKSFYSPPLILQFYTQTVRFKFNVHCQISKKKVIHATNESKYVITDRSSKNLFLFNEVISSSLKAQSNEPAVMEEEHFDVLTKTGQKTGISKPRSDIHREGDYHRAVHIWIFAESTQQLLLQKRAECKDSWAGLWDISCAGHISAGDSSLVTARRELQEELGIKLPNDAFELLFVFLQESVTNGGKFINNEYNDVYLVTTKDPIPLEAFTLQESEVSTVKYICFEEYRSLLAKGDPQYVHHDVDSKYGQLFEILSERYKQNAETRELALQKQLNRYARVSLDAEVLLSKPSLRDWLELHADESQLNKLKWTYYLVNKSPWYTFA